jgi:bacterioferritin
MRRHEASGVPRRGSAALWHEPRTVERREGDTTMPKPSQAGTNVTDREAIRRRARENLEDGAKTAGYPLDVDAALRLLDEAVATEMVCVLRYKFHATMAQGINSESVKKEFEQHAAEEQEHADMLCERIAQLGGKPNLDPRELASRAASQYVEGTDLVDMIKEDLVAERIAIDSYRTMIEFFGNQDPTTRAMLEKILAKEEEHATDMHDLLVAHEGKPMLKN